MNELSKKLIAFLIFAIIAGGVSFTYAKVLRDEADKFGGGARGEAMLICLQRYGDRLPNQSAAESACSCAVTEFERRRFDIAKLEIETNAEMEAVVDSCVEMAS